MSQYDIRIALGEMLGAVKLYMMTPNVKEKPPSTDYGEVSFIFNQPEAVTLGSEGEDEHTGILQVLLVTKLDVGDAPIYKMAEEFYPVFYAGASKQHNGNLVVITSCGVGAIGERNGRLVCPLTITWYSRLRRP